MNWENENICHRSLKHIVRIICISESNWNPVSEEMKMDKGLCMSVFLRKA